MYDRFGLFIDGNWRPARDGSVIPVVDPATEETLGAIPSAATADLDDALAAIAAAAPAWRHVSGWDRSALLRIVVDELRARAGEMATAVSRETGKPLAEARGEVNGAIDQFDWYADEARRIFGHSLAGRDPGVRLDVRYEPVGPVAAFTAWNFPALLPARKIAAALAAGCPIVIKPSEEAPSATFLIAEAARAAGLPAGVLNVVTGDPAMISRHLIASPVIRKVSLTGSVPVGRDVMRLAADGLKRLSLELGGHAPVIVFGDADPVAAGAACARAKFRNAGQVCISPTRFFVHRSVHDRFVRSMVETTRAIRIGRGLDEGTEFGPMINARGRERVSRLVDDAVGRGARLVVGGGPPPGFNRGYFYAPTVLDDVPADAAILTEEPFGPVAPILPFFDVDEVIRRANDVPYGLAAYVFTPSLDLANRAVDGLEAGMVGVNDMMLAAAEIPFGGVKHSGMGREGGRLGILDYVEPKYVRMRSA
jgi:succinate-semialdehyde dehydrogenase/glutarate-semialdehyde dehydrogenase